MTAVVRSQPRDWAAGIQAAHEAHVALHGDPGAAWEPVDFDKAFPVPTSTRWGAR